MPKPTAPIVNSIIPYCKTFDQVKTLKWCTDKGMEGFEIAFMITLCSIPQMEGAFAAGKRGAASMDKAWEDFHNEQDAVTVEMYDGFDPGSTEFTNYNLNKLIEVNIGDNKMHSTVINLIHVYKLQALESEHLTSFFASLGLEDTSAPKFAAFLTQLRPFLPIVGDAAGFADIRHENAFTDYRECRVSWPNLYKASSAFCKELMIGRYETADGADPKTFRGMEGNDMGILAAYLDANKAFPSGWHQGKKAKDKIQKDKYALWVNIFKRASVIALNADELDTIDDIELYRKTAMKFFQ